MPMAMPTCHGDLPHIASAVAGRRGESKGRRRIPIPIPIPIPMEMEMEGAGTNADGAVSPLPGIYASGIAGDVNVTRCGLDC